MRECRSSEGNGREPSAHCEEAMRWEDGVGGQVVTPLVAITLRAASVPPGLLSGHLPEVCCLCLFLGGHFYT